MPEPSERVKSLLRRWEKGQGAKDQWMNHWDDIARVQNPRREGFVTTKTEGERRSDDLFDGTPQIGARGLANAVGGMIRPEGQEWIKIRAENDRIDNMEEAKDWFARRQRQLFNAMYDPRARLRQATGEVDLDLVTLGTGILFAGESAYRRHLLFQSLYLRDAVPIFNDEGQADGVFLQREFSLRDAIARLGEANLSEAIRRKIKDDRSAALDEKLKLLHVVLPRNEGRPDALFSRNLPWAEYWVEIDQRHEVSEGGFYEFPYAIPRWDTSSGEKYGRSPGMIALPDSDTAQAMGQTLLVAGQRAADPPLAVPNDSTIQEYNTFPGGLTYYDIEIAAQMRGNPFFPLSTGGSVPLTYQMQQDVRNNIFAAFFRNVLNLPINGPQMTATEVIQRKEEFIRETGPVFGRLETDYTALFVERSFQTMLRAGAFDPIPPLLQEQNILFIYESPVKRIRQQVEAAAAHMWVLELLEIGAVKPEALDMINVEAYARFTAEANGLPRELIPSREQLDALRKQRQEQQSMRIELEQAMAATQAADQGAGALKSIAQAGATARPPQQQAA